MTLFSFTATATTEISTLSLHDALPIFADGGSGRLRVDRQRDVPPLDGGGLDRADVRRDHARLQDRKSTRLNSSHMSISYAVFCLKKKSAVIATLRSYMQGCSCRGGWRI